MQLVLSYGPCQFPTLGFVVERYKQIRDFKPEKFWSLCLKFARQSNNSAEGKKVEEIKFEWDRERLFDKMTTLVLYERCLDASIAKI